MSYTYSADNPSPAQIKDVRDKTWHYINPSIAAKAGLTIADQQQFIAGTFHPTPSQLHLLAIQYGIYPQKKKVA